MVLVVVLCVPLVINVVVEALSRIAVRACVGVVILLVRTMTML